MKSLTGYWERGVREEKGRVISILNTLSRVRYKIREIINREEEFGCNSELISQRKLQRSHSFSFFFVLLIFYSIAKAQESLENTIRYSLKSVFVMQAINYFTNPAKDNITLKSSRNKDHNS